jgi:hypothetical protein
MIVFYSLVWYIIEAFELGYTVPRRYRGSLGQYIGGNITC